MKPGLLAPALALQLTLAFSSGAPRPNIIFLLTDDQRYDTLGVTGNPIVKTPNLDRLGREGVIFDRAYVVSSACAPNRAAILSGMYNRSSGVRDFSADFTPAQRDLLYPFVLKDAGYYTGFIGKFGVASTIESTLEPYKNRIDYWRCFVGQGEYYTPDRQDKHIEQVITDDALEFFKTAPRDKPFCLSISYKAPHGPWSGFDKRFKDEFKDADIPFPPTLTEEAVAQLPPFLRTFRLCLDGKTVPEFRKIHQEWTRQYYRLILGADESVGHIRHALEENGLAENTVILFSSDNGHFLHEWGFYGKWLMHEPSIHVPLIVYDPRQPESRRGRRTGDFALSIDIAPTLLDYAGIPAPPNMQGRSLVPVANGATPPDWRKDFFYDYIFEMYPADIPRSIGVRNERWKYIRYTYQRPQYEQLFDLQNDPLELKNLAADPAHAAVLAQLRARLEEYRKELPDITPDYPEYADVFDVIGIGNKFPDSQVDFQRMPNIGQTFQAHSATLEAVEWRWPYFISKIPPMGVDVELRRGGPDGEVLAQATLPRENIYNLNLARAVFKAGGLTPGETLYVGISAQQQPQERQVSGTWYYTADIFPGGNAFFAGKPQPGDLPLYFIFRK
jgi:arylsulfatase A-like enzyme